MYKFINNYILAKFTKIVKKNQTDIILIIGVILISLLSFAMGYLTAQTQEKPPLIIEDISDV